MDDEVTLLQALVVREAGVCDGQQFSLVVALLLWIVGMAGD